MVQASLVFCLLLSLSVSSLTRRPVKIFIILAFNCLLHLLIDSLQIKWGNGVHLFAPFNWEIFRVGMFWPEHLPTQLISILGIPLLLYYWREIVRNGLELEYRSRLQIAGTTFFILSYFIGPFIFFNQLEATNSYYIKTMRQVEQRSGKDIEFDRAQYDEKNRTVKYFSGEEFILEGILPEKSGRVSLQGRFIATDTINSGTIHLHTDHRDLASIIGLFMACALTIHSLILTFLKKLPHDQD